MKIKTITVLLVAGLVVLAAMVVFAGTAAAQFFRIYGTITDAEGNPYVGHEVIIKKQHKLGWVEVWRPLNGTKLPFREGKYMPITNDTGYYDNRLVLPSLTALW